MTEHLVLENGIEAVSSRHVERAFSTTADNQSRIHARIPPAPPALTPLARANASPSAMTSALAPAARSFANAPRVRPRVPRRSSPSRVVPLPRSSTSSRPRRRVALAVSASAAADANEIPPAMPLVTVVEPETSRTLACMLRRRFKLQDGQERCLCLPLDHPVDVLRGEGLDENEDLSDIGDDELAQIIPDMAAALALKGMLLQRSAFCMTVRGAVRFNETDTLLMDTGGDDDESEGVELVTFTSGASRYLVYAPMNPVLLVTREIEGAGEDGALPKHAVMFDEEMDDATLEENLRAVEEELADEDDELFDDDDDMGLDLFEEEEAGPTRGGGRGGKRGGRGRGGRGGNRGRGGRRGRN